MEYIGQERAQRIYRDSAGVYHFVELRTQGYWVAVERSLLDSHDPADRARVDQVYARLRAKLAVFFAEHEEYDISDGILDQRVAPDQAHMRTADGLIVPAAIIYVEQPYWPPAPEETS